MNNKKFFNLDKLKICYRVPAVLEAKLTDEQVIECGMFTLHRTINSTGVVVAQVTIPYSVTKTKDVIFGELKINRDPVLQREYERFAWLTIENSVLYGHNFNLDLADVIESFKNTFGCIFNNVSAADIACDVQYNAAAAIFKVLRTHNFDIMVMGRTIQDVTAECPYICYECFGSLVEFTKMHIRIHGKDSKFQFYCYDKKKDIPKKKKGYILKKYNIDPETLFRLEVRLDTDHCRKSARKHHMSEEEWLYNYLLLEDSLEDTWKEFSRQFIRIKKDRRHIWDILTFIENDVISNGVSFCHIPF